MQSHSILRIKFDQETSIRNEERVLKSDPKIILQLTKNNEETSQLSTNQSRDLEVESQSIIRVNIRPITKWVQDKLIKLRVSFFKPDLKMNSKPKSKLSQYTWDSKQ